MAQELCKHVAVSYCSGRCVGAVWADGGASYAQISFVKLVACWAGSSCPPERAVSEQGACGCWVDLVRLAGDRWESELPLKGRWARSHPFARLQRVFE